MSNLTWKILELSAEDELITHAKYQASLSDGNICIETEGNVFFQDPILKVPFSEVTEKMVVSWIEQETMKDGINQIKLNLEQQLASANKDKAVVAPWLPQMFTPNN
jgi:hypothetical protein